MMVTGPRSGAAIAFSQRALALRPLSSSKRYEIVSSPLRFVLVKIHGRATRAGW